MALAIATALPQAHNGALDGSLYSYSGHKRDAIPEPPILAPAPGAQLPEISSDAEQAFALLVLKKPFPKPRHQQQAAPPVRQQPPQLPAPPGQGPPPTTRAHILQAPRPQDQPQQQARAPTAPHQGPAAPQQPYVQPQFHAEHRHENAGPQQPPFQQHAQPAPMPTAAPQPSGPLCSHGVAYQACSRRAEHLEEIDRKLDAAFKQFLFVEGEKLAQLQQDCRNLNALKELLMQAPPAQLQQQQHVPQHVQHHQHQSYDQPQQGNHYGAQQEHHAGPSAVAGPPQHQQWQGGAQQLQHQSSFASRQDHVPGGAYHHPPVPYAGQTSFGAGPGPYAPPDSGYSNAQGYGNAFASAGPTTVGAFAGRDFSAGLPPPLEVDQAALRGVQGNRIDVSNEPLWRQENFPWSQKLRRVNHEQFGNKDFRFNQLAICNATLHGNDVFVLMPTGGGKSLCYQLPALLSRGVTIVICPLVSLIQDQVYHLENMGIPVANLGSSNGVEFDWGSTMQRIHSGDVKVLFLTPEKLESSLATKKLLIKLYDNGQLARVVIDEAHCVSQWGHGGSLP